jgi:hypothetical protein
MLAAALMLVGIPLLIVGVIAWVVLPSLAAVKASQGEAYPLSADHTVGPLSDQAQKERPIEAFWITTGSNGVQNTTLSP